MYICVCKAVSDRDIRRAAHEDGVVSLRELSRRTGLGTCCGKCVPVARELLEREALSVPARHDGAVCASLGGTSIAA